MSIDGRGNGIALSGADLVELHEDEVPELQEAVAVLVGAAGRPAEDRFPLVVEDFGAGTTRAGVAGRPEVVGGRDADDAALRQAGDLLPQIESFVVVVIDGDEQALLVEPEVPRHQRPGILDRGRLEVVAEREIAEHLEKRVVSGGIADIVEIVMLAAGPQTLLGRGGAAVGAFLDAGEQVLELHHPGTGEHQRRIVAGDEWPRRDDLVSRLAEEIEKGRAGLVDAGHGRGTRSSGSRALGHGKGRWPHLAAPLRTVERAGRSPRSAGLGPIRLRRYRPRRARVRRSRGCGRR